MPTLYAAMLAAKGAERFDLSSLRLCVSAGEALPADLYRRWRERYGVEIVDGIGTTESGHIFLSNRPGAVRPGSSGLPVPGYECAIVDDEWLRVPVGEIGSLRVRGDSTMAYYWNKHDKTKETLFGPWIQTGDKYHQDADGYFWVPWPRRHAEGGWHLGLADRDRGDAHPASRGSGGRRGRARRTTMSWLKPRAYVVPKDLAGASESLAGELRAFVKEKIAPDKYPRWIDFVPELPKTATGKIQRFKLRQAGSPP